MCVCVFVCPPPHLSTSVANLIRIIGFTIINIALVYFVVRSSKSTLVIATGVVVKNVSLVRCSITNRHTGRGLEVLLALVRVA